MRKINLSKRWISIFSIGAFLILILSTSAMQNSEWSVPAEYAKKVNPIEADDQSIEIGETIYAKHCKSCHGKYGEGDGSKAADLETSCGDFTLEEYQSQSDGSLFYKIYEGRDEMPGFSKKIPDAEDIWHVINFTRTLE